MRAHFAAILLFDKNNHFFVEHVFQAAPLKGSFKLIVSFIFRAITFLHYNCFIIWKSES